MSLLPRLFQSEVRDQFIRDNFRILSEFIRDHTVFRGFRSFEVTFTQAVTAHKFPHNMGFKPLDIILTSKTNSVTVEFLYSNTTATVIEITTSAATTIRFLAGTFAQGR